MDTHTHTHAHTEARKGRRERGWLVFNGVEACDRIVRTVLSSLVGSGPSAPSPFACSVEEESCAAAQPGVPSA